MCGHCKQLVTIPRDQLLAFGFKEQDLVGLKLYGPKGCDQCSNGYKGRAGIYQVVPISEAMGRIIMEGGNSMQIADQAKKEGIPDLRESGIKKMKDGLTSIEEISRVTKE